MPGEAYSQIHRKLAGIHYAYYVDKDLSAVADRKGDDSSTNLCAYLHAGPIRRLLAACQCGQHEEQRAGGTGHRGGCGIASLGISSGVTA